MKVKQYILVYEDNIKKLVPVRELEWEGFGFEINIDNLEPEEKEEVIEKIVDCFMYFLNEHFQLGYLAEEHLILIALDYKYNVIAVFEVSHGTEDGCDAGAKEIFTRLLMVNAKRFIEFHNHPKSGVMLSKADQNSWEHLRKIAEALDIDMITSAVVSEELCNYFEE